MVYTRGFAPWPQGISFYCKKKYPKEKTSPRCGFYTASLLPPLLLRIQAGELARFAQEWTSSQKKTHRFLLFNSRCSLLKHTLATSHPQSAVGRNLLYGAVGFGSTQQDFSKVLLPAKAGLACCWVENISTQPITSIIKSVTGTSAKEKEAFFFSIKKFTQNSSDYLEPATGTSATRYIVPAL